MARVLVVDDEPQIVNAVTRALSREGHDVSGTGSGVDALSEVATRPPDAVVLDLGLPDIGGVEVVRRLRGWNDVPVLILSAAGGEAARLQHRTDVAMYAAKAAGKHRWRRSCDDRGVLGASPQDEPPDLELDLQGAVPARPSARPPRVPRARAVPARPPFPS